MTTPSKLPATAAVRQPRLTVPGLSVEDLWLAPDAAVIAALSGPDSTGTSTLLFLDTRSGAQRGIVRVGPEELGVLSRTWSFGATHNWVTGTIEVWRPDSGAPVGRLTPHQGGGVQVLALTDRGDVGASLGEDGRIVLWRPVDGVVLTTFEPRSPLDLEQCGLGFSPDGHLLAVRTDVDTIELWRTDPLTLVDHLADFGEPVFSPDGRWIAVDGEGGIALHDLTTGGPPVTLPGVGPVGFTADGALLVAGGQPGRTTVWRTAPAEAIGSLSGNAWALSPDGAALILIDTGSELTLVDTPTGRTVATLTGHRGDIQALALGPGGRVVAAACSDATLRVWAP